MKCTLDNKNARIFSKALQSLSRIGYDLFLEANEGLVLKTINSTKSAVGTFRFSKKFFDSFEHSSSSKKNERIFCKVSMKALELVFKNMKQVESCQIRIENPELLQVKLKYRLQTVKNVLVRIIDDKNVMEVPLVDNMANLIVGSHKIFAEVANNFQILEEEITLEAWKGTLNVKNYIEGSRVNDKFMRSQLKLSSAEFQTYQISEETAITFCLKEFRAFLLFSESLNEDLLVNFQEPGNPVVFRLKKLDLIECILTMSTLTPEDISFNDSCRMIEDINVSFADAQGKRKSAPVIKLNNKKIKSNPNPEISLPSGNLKPFPELYNSIDVPRNLFQRNIQSTCESNRKNIADLSTVPNTSQFTNTNDEIRAQGRQDPNTEIEVTFIDTEDLYNMIKSTSQRNQKRELRSIFSRCFDATYVPTEPSPSSQNFVPDSDTEN